METLPEKCKLTINRTEFSLTESHHIKPDIIGRLIRIFTVSKEDRLKAGIYVGSEGRDWIERSALYFPFLDQDNVQANHNDNST